MTETSFLSLLERRIAHVLNEGKAPTIIFCGGFKSDMTGAKAIALENFCRARGQRFIRFDYTGHGQSSGAFTDGTIGAWLGDALSVIDQLGGEEILLVGSSMGAWIALLAARARKEKIIGLMTIAAAPDFTEKLIWQQLKPEQQKQMLEEGLYHAPSCYGQEPYPITRKLVEDGRNHLLLDAPIALDIPARLMHGTKDQDVPWQISATLLEKLQSNNATLTLIKDGDHRLSTPEHLAKMLELVESLL